MTWAQIANMVQTLSHCSIGARTSRLVGERASGDTAAQQRNITVISGSKWCFR